MSKDDSFSYDVPMKGARESGGIRKKREEMRERSWSGSRREFGVMRKDLRVGIQPKLMEKRGERKDRRVQSKENKLEEEE